MPGEPGEELVELGVVQIADRAAEEEQQERGQVAERREDLLPRARERADVEPRVLGAQARARRIQGRGADVDRDVAHGTRGAAPGVEQPAGLDRAAAAELDQAHWPNEPAQLVS